MKKQSKTDWERLRAMKDKDIDTSDIPELTDDFFKKAVVWPGTKRQITLRLDPDVIDFFKKQGRGYQTTINTVLRKYVEAHSH
ncbi:MAG: BrnA antitoxin family protein [Nitrospirae bacterium]|nr:BrnA antitoxin family protein [Nitrospirota bacterium]